MSVSDITSYQTFIDRLQSENNFGPIEAEAAASEDFLLRVQKGIEDTLDEKAKSRVTQAYEEVFGLPQGVDREQAAIQLGTNMMHFLNTRHQNRKGFGDSIEAYVPLFGEVPRIEDIDREDPVQMSQFAHATIPTSTVALAGRNAWESFKIDAIGGVATILADRLNNKEFTAAANNYIEGLHQYLIDNPDVSKFRDGAWEWKDLFLDPTLMPGLAAQNWPSFLAGGLAIASWPGAIAGGLILGERELGAQYMDMKKSGAHSETALSQALMGAAFTVATESLGNITQIGIFRKAFSGTKLDEFAKIIKAPRKFEAGRNLAIGLGGFGVRFTKEVAKVTGVEGIEEVAQFYGAEFFKDIALSDTIKELEGIPGTEDTIADLEEQIEGLYDQEEAYQSFKGAVGAVGILAGLAGFSVNLRRLRRSPVTLKEEEVGEAGIRKVKKEFEVFKEEETKIEKKYSGPFKAKTREIERGVLRKTFAGVLENIKARAKVRKAGETEFIDEDLQFTDKMRDELQYEFEKVGQTPEGRDPVVNRDLIVRAATAFGVPGAKVQKQFLAEFDVPGGEAIVKRFEEVLRRDITKGVSVSEVVETFEKDKSKTGDVIAALETIVDVKSEVAPEQQIRNLLTEDQIDFINLTKGQKTEFAKAFKGLPDDVIVAFDNLDKESKTTKSETKKAKTKVASFRQKLSKSGIAKGDILMRIISDRVTDLETALADESISLENANSAIETLNEISIDFNEEIALRKKEDKEANKEEVEARRKERLAKSQRNQRARLVDSNTKLADNIISLGADPDVIEATIDIKRSVAANKSLEKQIAAEQKISVALNKELLKTRTQQRERVTAKRDELAKETIIRRMTTALNNPANAGLFSEQEIIDHLNAAERVELSALRDLQDSLANEIKRRKDDPGTYDAQVELTRDFSAEKVGDIRKNPNNIVFKIVGEETNKSQLKSSEIKLKNALKSISAKINKNPEDGDVEIRESLERGLAVIEDRLAVPEAKDRLRHAALGLLGSMNRRIDAFQLRDGILSEEIESLAALLTEVEALTAKVGKAGFENKADDFFINAIRLQRRINARMTQISEDLTARQKAAEVQEIKDQEPPPPPPSPTPTGEPSDADVRVVRSVYFEAQEKNGVKIETDALTQRLFSQMRRFFIYDPQNFNVDEAGRLAKGTMLSRDIKGLLAIADDPDAAFTSEVQREQWRGFYTALLQQHEARMKELEGKDTTELLNMYAQNENFAALEVLLNTSGLDILRTAANEGIIFPPRYITVIGNSRTLTRADGSKDVTAPAQGSLEGLNEFIKLKLQDATLTNKERNKWKVLSSALEFELNDRPLRQKAFSENKDKEVDQLVASLGILNREVNDLIRSATNFTYTNIQANAILDKMREYFAVKIALGESSVPQNLLETNSSMTLENLASNDHSAEMEGQDTGNNQYSIADTTGNGSSKDSLVRKLGELVKSVKGLVGYDIEFMSNPAEFDAQNELLEDTGEESKLSIDFSEGERSGQFKSVNTKSKGFKSWFSGADKLVKNPDGTPKQLFHGTLKPEGFTAFDKNLRGMIFLSPDANTAASFGGGLPDSRVIPVYINAENIFDYENSAHVDAVIDKYERGGGGLTKKQTRIEIEKGDFHTIESVKIRNIIRDLGFDGLTSSEASISNDPQSEPKNIAVFEPSSVKSSITNIGAFSRKDIDIRFAIGEGIATKPRAKTDSRAKALITMPDANGRRRVIVFTDNTTTEDLHGVLIHEVFGHDILAKIIGEENFLNMLDRITEMGKLGNVSFQRIAKLYRESNPTISDRLIAEEVMTNWLQDPRHLEPMGFFRGILRKIKRSIKRLFGIDVTEEAITDMLRQAYGVFKSNDRSTKTMKRFLKINKEITVASDVQPAPKIIENFTEVKLALPLVDAQVALRDEIIDRFRDPTAGLDFFDNQSFETSFQQIGKWLSGIYTQLDPQKVVDYIKGIDEDPAVGKAINASPELKENFDSIRDAWMLVEEARSTPTKKGIIPTSTAKVAESVSRTAMESE